MSKEKLVFQSMLIGNKLHTACVTYFVMHKNLYSVGIERLQMHNFAL